MAPAWTNMLYTLNTLISTRTRLEADQVSPSGNSPAIQRISIKYAFPGFQDIPCANTVGVPRCPGNLDRMNIRKPGNQRHHREVHPLRRRAIERIQRDQHWQRPNLEDDGRDDSAVHDLTEVGGEQEHEHSDDRGRDGE